MYMLKKLVVKNFAINCQETFHYLVQKFVVNLKKLAIHYRKFYRKAKKMDNIHYPIKFLVKLKNLISNTVQILQSQIFLYLIGRY